MIYSRRNMILRTSVLLYIIIAGQCLFAESHKDDFVKIESNYSGVVVSSYLTLSIVECISVCAIKTECQAVTLYEFNSSCILYGQVTEYTLANNGSQSPTICLSYMIHSLAKCGTGWTYVDNSCYYVQRIRITWKDAKALCESLNGYLAVISTQREQDLVVDRFNKTAERGVWLGGFYNGSTSVWAWTTGEIWNYTNFAIGYISSSEDECLALGNRQPIPSRAWKSRNCTHVLYTLCELNLV